MPAGGAEPAPPVWQGVWEGTIGTLPIRACFQRRGADDPVAAYYYLSRLRPIRLEQQGNSKLWLETGDAAETRRSPQWRFDGVGRTLLTGAWSVGAKQLPFRLTRIGGEAEDEPCGGPAFNAPRLRPLKPSATRATFGGVAYTKLAFDPGPGFGDVSLATFALDGDGAAVRRLNMGLRHLMSGAAVSSEWYGCVTSALGSTGTEGEYRAATTPELITPRWLAASQTISSYCGGAYPNAGVTSLLFDRATGAAVDLQDWLNDAAIERRRLSPEDATVKLRSGLRRLLAARDKAVEADCRGASADAAYWDVGLRREGLRFTPSLAHVEQACAKPVLAPWATLLPFLTAAGRAGMAGVQGSPRP